MIICLMGPTASGKTALAIELVKHFPVEIVSVDSAMVYRGMDIGTAKPDAQILKVAPHRLIDIVDPDVAYSAGQFHVDAVREIEQIKKAGNIPLLVGGTMLYFRVLQQGIAKLPQADPALRAELSARAKQEGWEGLHALLKTVDPEAAIRIEPRDGQRIQRALEVYMLTGKTISSWQMENTSPLAQVDICNIALLPSDRVYLHQQIAERFQHMLKLGLVDEVRALYERGNLTPDLPSMRSVGYRQVWQYFAGEMNYEAMCDNAIIATRQLAKRQMTWLRSWPDMTLVDAYAKNVFDQVAKIVGGVIKP